MLTEAYDEWAVVILNLRKVRKWWEKMLRILGQEESNKWVSTIFTMPWPNQSYYMGQGCGSWRPGWSGPSGPSTTGCPVGWWGHRYDDEPTGDGSTHPWRRLWKRRGWRRLRYTLLVIITPFPNILQLVWYWSCVWRQRGAQGHGSQIGSGNRRACTGRAHGRRRGQRGWIKKSHRRTGRATSMNNNVEGNSDT